MAFPKCPHCDSAFYQLAIIEPAGSNYKANLVICSGCGAPVGALDYYDAGVLIQEQGETLAAMMQTLERLQRDVTRLASNAAEAKKWAMAAASR
jgi:hypothetical protein